MDELYPLLRGYIAGELNSLKEYGWVSQYLSETPPYYWAIVYSIANSLPRNLRIVEVGAGLGCITAIFKYLGFAAITSYEQDYKLASVAERLIQSISSPSKVEIIPEIFDTQKVVGDLLVLVNCVYADVSWTKADYKEYVKKLWVNSGRPRRIILEVIDASYQEINADFPICVRLSKNDIISMFPNSKIHSWETYKYPINGKSKTLYFIEP